MCTDRHFSFAFTWHQQYTWTAMYQGDIESPTYFFQILKADIEDIVFSNNFTSMHYVDDLLFCSSEEAFLADSL